MVDDRSQRIGSALSALVETLVHPLTDEDDASLDERRDDALALAKSVLDGSVADTYFLYRFTDLLQSSESLGRAQCQPCIRVDQGQRLVPLEQMNDSQLIVTSPQEPKRRS